MHAAVNSATANHVEHDELIAASTVNESASATILAADGAHEPSSSSSASDESKKTANDLSWFHGAGQLTSLKGLQAKEAFVSSFLRKIRVEKSDKSRIDLVTLSFKMVATPEELSEMSKGMPEVEFHRLAAALHDRVVGRLLSSYEALKEEPPGVLHNWKDLLVHSLSDRITELDKLKPGTSASDNHKTKFTTITLSKEEIALLPQRPNAKKHKAAVEKGGIPDDDGCSGTKKSKS